jgi:nucleotide-binding universal stress UspA family protein
VKEKTMLRMLIAIDGSDPSRRAIDQIVLGTHGRGPVGTLFLGSVALRVLHLARIPVLLVR